MKTSHASLSLPHTALPASSIVRGYAVDGKARKQARQELRQQREKERQEREKKKKKKKPSVLVEYFWGGFALLCVGAGAFVVGGLAKSWFSSDSEFGVYRKIMAMIESSEWVAMRMGKPLATSGTGKRGYGVKQDGSNGVFELHFGLSGPDDKGFVLAKCWMDAHGEPHVDEIVIVLESLGNRAVLLVSRGKFVPLDHKGRSKLQPSLYKTKGAVGKLWSKVGIGA